MAVVVETSVIIGFLKGNHPEVRFVEKKLREGELCLSAITVFELKVGIVSNSKHDQRLAGLFQAATVFPFDQKAALCAAAIENELRTRGEVIGVPDTLIAGTCLALRLPLVTLNPAHFRRVRSLTVAPLM